MEKKIFKNDHRVIIAEQLTRGAERENIKKNLQ